MQINMFQAFMKSNLIFIYLFLGYSCNTLTSIRKGLKPAYFHLFFNDLGPNSLINVLDGEIFLVRQRLNSKLTQSGKKKKVF